MLINKAKRFKPAAALQRAIWGAVFGSHLPTVKTLEDISELLLPDVWQLLRHTVQHRVHAEYDGPRGETQHFKPHPSLIQHLEEAFRSLWKDVSTGRVLLGSNRVEQELRGLVCTSFGRALKRQPDRTIAAT